MLENLNQEPNKDSTETRHQMPNKLRVHYRKSDCDYGYGPAARASVDAYDRLLDRHDEHPHDDEAVHQNLAALVMIQRKPEGQPIVLRWPQ